MVDRLIPGTLRPGVTMEFLAEEVAALRAEMDLMSRSTTSPSPQSKTSEQANAFMIMPFGPEDLQVVYEEFIRPALTDACGLSCTRGDDIFGSNVVMDDVVSAITASDLIVADLTGRNPNVFYEVGIAHALAKPVLLLAQSVDDVPFDLRHRRVQPYEYSPKGCKRLEQAIVEHVTAILRSGR
jgi:hypothetical protein